MNEYRGISKSKYPNWDGWKHIALYECITDDFDDDKSLQRLVKQHYLKQKLLIIGFNLMPYIIIYIIAKGIG